MKINFPTRQAARQFASADTTVHTVRMKAGAKHRKVVDNGAGSVRRWSVEIK